MRPFYPRTTVAPAFGLLVIIGCLASPASAELRKCNGVWTNRPCESKDGPSISEIPYREPSPEEQSLKERKKLLYALETTATTLRSKGGAIDLAVTRELCLGQNTTTDECKTAILDKEKEINAALLVVATQAPPDQAVVVPRSDGQANVTVIDNRDDWQCSGHRRPRHYRNFDPHNPFPPRDPPAGIPSTPPPSDTPGDAQPTPDPLPQRPNVSRWGNR
jgi:hypothetical protein